MECHVMTVICVIHVLQTRLLDCTIIVITQKGSNQCCHWPHRQYSNQCCH